MRRAPGGPRCERETKLSPPPGFRLPDLDGCGASPPSSATRSCSRRTYYDTDDLRLRRAGASLRYRNHDGWTVKLAGRRRRRDARAGRAPRRGSRPARRPRPRRTSCGRTSAPRRSPRSPACGPARARIDLVDRRRQAPGRGRRRRGLGARRPPRRRPVPRARGRDRRGRAGAVSPPTIVRPAAATPARATPTPPRRSCGPSDRAPSHRPTSSRPGRSRPTHPAGEVVRGAIAGLGPPARSPTTPGCASATTPSSCTRPGSRPAGSAPTSGRSARCSIRSGCQSLRDELRWLADELGAVRDTEVLLGLLPRQGRAAPRARPRRGRRPRRRGSVVRWEHQRIELLGAMRSAALLRPPRPARRRRARAACSLDASAPTPRRRRAPAARGRSVVAPRQAADAPRPRPGRRGAARRPHPGQAVPGTRRRRSTPVVGTPARRAFAAPDRGAPGRARRPPRRDRRRGVAARGGHATATPAEAFAAGELAGLERVDEHAAARRVARRRGPPRRGGSAASAGGSQRSTTPSTVHAAGGVVVRPGIATARTRGRARRTGRATTTGRSRRASSSRARSFEDAALREVEEETGLRCVARRRAVARASIATGREGRSSCGTG